LNGARGHFGDVCGLSNFRSPLSLNPRLLELQLLSLESHPVCIKVEEEFDNSLVNITDTEVCRDRWLQRGPATCLLDHKVGKDALQIERPFGPVE
jgi:hypothetical protein